MKFVALLCISLAFCGCTPKGESTLDKLSAMKKAPKAPPPGGVTQTQIGIPFYPEADYIEGKEFDEGDNHVMTVVLDTKADSDKVARFYERELNAKAMPMVAGTYSIERILNGKHISVRYMKSDSDTSVELRSEAAKVN